MESTILNTTSARSFMVVLEPGEEALDRLARFTHEHGLRSGRFTALGAFENAVVAYWDWDSKAYHDVEVREQVEVLSMIGDISMHDGAPIIHAHVVLGRRDGSTMGGHLRRGTVRPALEVMLTEATTTLQRVTDRETGLPLLRLSHALNPWQTAPGRRA